MKRRNFLGSSASAALAAVAGVEVTQDSAYRPCGFLDPDTVGAHEMDFVTVDGRRVEHPTALNDIEGWVEHLGPVAAVVDGRVRKYHVKGVVRVHWREKPATLSAP